MTIKDGNQEIEVVKDAYVYYTAKRSVENDSETFSEWSDLSESQKLGVVEWLNQLESLVKSFPM